jgi:cell division protein FtsQ
VTAAVSALRRLRVFSPRAVLTLPGRLLLVMPARTRRRVVALAVVGTALFALYMLVLRDLGVVAVHRVQVTGLTGRDAARAAAALEEAGRRSTTLHVDRGALDAARERFPSIRAIRVQTSFPHGMHVTVIEQRPAAMLVVGAKRIPVAGDGSILSSLPVTDPLPVVKVDPGAIPSRRLTPSGTLDAVRVAGGAPALLTPRLSKVSRDPKKGWIVQVTDGPQLIFGPATRLADKWAAAVRVLADRDAAGADYIDLRIPDRPAAGGLSVQTVQPVAPADAQDPQAAAGQATTPQAATQATTPQATTPSVTPQTSTPAPAGQAPATPSNGTQP